MANASLRALFVRGVLLALLVVAVLFWWERRIEAGDPASTSFAAWDDYDYYFPTSRYAFGELRAGRFPFWSPYQHAGAPFFATAQHGLLYPPNVLHLVLDDAFVEKVAALLHLTIAGLGAALLVRAWGQSWPAAATSGVAFAFAPSITGLVYPPTSPVRRRLDAVAPPAAASTARLAGALALGTRPGRMRRCSTSAAIRCTA